jgi:septum site-determining protein MinC
MSTNDTVAIASLTVTSDDHTIILGINSPVITDDGIREVLDACGKLDLVDVIIEINAPTAGSAGVRRLVAAVEEEANYTVQAVRGSPAAVAAMLLESVRVDTNASPRMVQPSGNRERDPADWVPSGNPVPPDLSGARRTTQVHGTVRSGRIVRFDGDVILIGDVNPGAQVSATGDVFVLGKIKGQVHAGSAGDDQSFIFALGHGASSLRLGPTEQLLNEDDACDSPTVAFLKNNQINLVPFTGKVPR